MWWTPDGERVLQGAEAGLFRAALATIVDMFREDEEGLWRFNAPPFDELHPAQKLALLAQVGSSLLREETPAPDLTAVTEATVGAIYEVIRLMVEWEIDQPAAWRIMVQRRAKGACKDFYASRWLLLYRHQRAESLGKCLGLAHHPEVVGMAAVDRALGVVSQHALVGEEMQVLDARRRQLLMDRAKDGSFFGGTDVPDTTILDQANGRVRAGYPQPLHEGLDAGRYLLRRHVP